MHELPITQSILDIALRHGDSANAKKITHLYIVIGQLSSVIDDSVQFYWDILSKDTLAEGSQLHFERIPAKLSCQECEQEYLLEDGSLMPCPSCGSIKVNIIEGKEFRLGSIEIEEE